MSQYDVNKQLLEWVQRLEKRVTQLEQKGKPVCPDCGKTDGWLGVHVCNTEQVQ